MSSGKRFALAFAAVLVALGFAALRADAVVNQTKIDILNQSEDEIQLRFTSTTGSNKTITFVQQDLYGHTVWMTETNLLVGGGVGIAFGNTSPKLPKLVMLKDRQIDPKTVVKPFSAAIANEVFDDLTIYQSWNDEVVIALYQDGMITSIYNAGLWTKYAEESVHPHPPGALCDQWRELCCRTELVPGPDPENPGIDAQVVPDPYIPACASAHSNCGGSHQTAVCTCLEAACYAGVEDINGQACDKWWDCCGGGGGCGGNALVALYAVMGEFEATKQ